MWHACGLWGEGIGSKENPLQGGLQKTDWKGPGKGRQLIAWRNQEFLEGYDFEAYLDTD